MEHGMLDAHELAEMRDVEKQIKDREQQALLRQIVREEVRKALDEELRLLRIRQGIALRAYSPPRLETKDLPAWTRYEETGGPH